MPTNYLRRNMDLACSFSGTTFTLTMDSSYPVRIGGQVIKTFTASNPYIINASFNIVNAAGEAIVSIPNSNVYDIAGNSISSTTYNNKQFPFYKSYDEINTETGEIEVKTGPGMYSMDSGSSTTVSSIFKTGDIVICIIDVDNVRIYLCSETIFNHIMESCADIDNFLSITFPSFYDYVIKYNETIMEYINSMMESIESLTDEVDSLSEEVDSLSDEVDSLSDEVDSLSDNVDSLTDTVDSLSDEVDSLSDNVDSLTKDVDSLSDEVDSLSDEVDSLSDNVDSLTENVDSLTENVDSLTEDVDSLTEDVGNIMNYIEYIMDFINNHEDDGKLIMLDDKDHSDNTNSSERIQETLDAAIEFQDSSQEKYAYMRINQENNYILDNGDTIYGNLSVNELYSDSATGISVAPISYVKCESDSVMHIVNTPYCWFSVYNTASKTSSNEEFLRNISIGSIVTNGSNQVVLLYSDVSQSNTSTNYIFAYAIAYFNLLYPNFVDGSTTLDQLPNLENNAAFVVNNVLYISLEFIQTPVVTSETLKTSNNPTVNSLYAAYDLSGIEMFRCHSNIYGYVSDEFTDRFCTEYNSSLYSLCLNSTSSSGSQVFSETLFQNNNTSGNEENYYWGIASVLRTADCSYSSSSNSITSSYGSGYNGFYPIPKSNMYFNAVFKADNRLSIKVDNTAICFPINLSCMSYKSGSTTIDLYYDMSDFAGSWWNGTFMNNSLQYDNGFYLKSNGAIAYIDMLYDTMETTTVTQLLSSITSYYEVDDGSYMGNKFLYAASSNQNEISVDFYNSSASVQKNVKEINNIKYLSLPIAEFSLNYTNYLKTYSNFVLNSTDTSNSYTGALGSKYNDDDDRLYSMHCTFNYVKYVFISRTETDTLPLNNDEGYFAMTTDNSILSKSNGISSVVAKFGFRYPVINDTINNINTNICNILVTHYLYGVCNIEEVLSGVSIDIDKDTDTWLTIKNENLSCSYNIMNPYSDSKKITIDNFLRYMLNTDSMVLNCRRRNYDIIEYYKKVKNGRQLSVGTITPLTVKLIRNDEYVTGARNREGALSSPLNDGLVVLYCTPIDLIYADQEAESTSGGDYNFYHEGYRVNNDTNERDDSISNVIQLGIGTGQYIAVWFDETGKMCYKADGTMPTTSETGGIVVSNVVKADDTNDVKIVYDLVVDHSSNGYTISGAKTYDANGNESSSGSYYKIYNGVLKINLDALGRTEIPIGILDDTNSFISVTKNSVVARRDKHIKSLSEISKFSDAMIQTIDSYGPAYDSSLYPDYVSELYKTLPCYNLFLNSYTSAIESYNDAYKYCLDYITTSTTNSDYLIHPKYLLKTSGLNKINLSSTSYSIKDSETLTKNDFLSMYDFFDMAINHYLNIDPDSQSSLKSTSIRMSIFDMTQLQTLIDNNQSGEIYFFSFYMDFADQSSGYYNKIVIPVDSDGNEYESNQNINRYNLAISGKNKTKSISLTDEEFNDLPLDGSLGTITTSALTWSDLLDALNNNKSISIGQQSNFVSDTLYIHDENAIVNIDLVSINPSWGDGTIFGSE